MRVYVWTDRHTPATARAVIQRGECTHGHCGQFSISISNGRLGLTVRFESESEYRAFLERGEMPPFQSSDGSRSDPPA